MRPFFPYYGSKYRLAGRYPAPSGDVIEPFAGSACYSIWHGVERATLIDADPQIAAAWRYLLSATPEEIMALPDLPNEGDSVDDLDVGAQALVGFWLTKGAAPVRRRGAYAARPQWAHLFWRPQIKDRIASQLSRIQGWTFMEGDFAIAPNLADATYFIDPPYQSAGRHYRVGFDDFERLAEWSRSLSGRVIVCEGVGADWLPFAPLGDFKTFRGSSPEVVWLQDAAG